MTGQGSHFRLYPAFLNPRVLLILGIACSNWMGFVKAGAEELPLGQPQSIPVGERLVYKISWFGIPVGTGELWAQERTELAGREVIHVVGLIENNKFLSAIFPMRDEIHSWIDAETLESVQFEKKVNESKIKADEVMVFDRTSGKGSYESFETGEKKEFDVQVPVHDVCSAFYWVRRQVLVPGESVKVTLTCDRKDWALEAHVLRRETLKLHGEKVETLRIEPVTVVEGEERRGRAWFNVTDDPSHTPVRIVYKAPFGSVVGVLKNVKL